MPYYKPAQENFKANHVSWIQETIYIITFNSI